MVLRDSFFELNMGIDNRVGTRYIINGVPIRTPKLILTARGIRNWACKLCSMINGNIPKKVVRVVKVIGLNLALADAIDDSLIDRVLDTLL